MRPSAVARATGIALILSVFIALFSTAEGLAGGQLRVAIFLFFPVIYGTGLFAFAAVLFIFLSFVLFFVFSSMRMVVNAVHSPYEPDGVETGTHQDTVQGMHERHPEGRRKFGGALFIGPVPIIFGSNGKVTEYMLIMAVIMAVLMAASLLFQLL